MQTTSAGTRIVTGADAKKLRTQTSARANAVYNAEQKRRAGMTEQQRWDEDFNNHLSDQAGAGKDQYNLAWDNYKRDLDDAVARGSMTKQQAESARQHILGGIRDKQRQFHSDYLKSYDNGDHTDSDRQGIRSTKIWTTHGDNGLVHFRHGDFGENTTFGGAERGYAQRDARMAAGGGRGGVGASGAPAGVRGGSTGANAGVGGTRAGATRMPNNRAQAARPNDASRAYDMQYGPKQPVQAKPQAPASTTANASNVTPTAPPSPITFKGGYTVGGVSGDVDWAAKGDGSINVGGAKLTADQYNAFNNVRSSLTTQLRQQEGLSHTEARARATQMANQWMADQTAVANGGKVQNRWQHVETPRPATQPVTPAQPVAQPEAQPVTPAQSTAQPTPGTVTGTDTTYSPAQSEQPSQSAQPASGSGAGAPSDTGTGATTPAANPAPTADPAQLSSVVGHDANASNRYISMLRDNRKSTLDPEKYKAVEGYNGIYTKAGDRTGALYDRFGKQFTYQGKPVDDALLATDEDWWLPGYGDNIRANISAHEDNRFRDNIFRPDELSAIGFTEQVAGHKGHWRNPATGEIIDGNGKVYGGGTALHDVPIHRANSARHSNYHGMAWWYDGSRHDVGVQ